MDWTDFYAFCIGKSLSQDMALVFRDYLTQKYPKGIPADVNLDSEYRSLMQEGTSKLHPFTSGDES